MSLEVELKCKDEQESEGQMIPVATKINVTKRELIGEFVSLVFGSFICVRGYRICILGNGR